jgi:hypothetical protein
VEDFEFLNRHILLSNSGILRVLAVCRYLFYAFLMWFLDYIRS